MEWDDLMKHERFNLIFSAKHFISENDYYLISFNKSKIAGTEFIWLN